MHIHDALETLPAIKKPIAITIGNFDGVHRGHKAVLDRLKTLVSNAGGESVVLSFQNHPAEVLRPEVVIPRLCSINHKIKLLEEQGISHLILLTFTQEFAKQSAEAFLRHLQTFCPFDYLILGHDATIGNERKGDRKHIHELSKALNFKVEYLDEQSYQEMLISSSRIRQEIQKGHFEIAERLLGRPYSIYAPLSKGLGLGKQIGFPTLNVDISGLCLPPNGVYAVKLLVKGKLFLGVANLGVAPTVRQDRKLILEVHLFNPPSSIEGWNEVEVVFSGYIRPEKRFENIEMLKAQITQDVKRAQEILG